MARETDLRVLGQDAVGVPAFLDHLVLALALRGDEPESGVLDDGALDVHVAEVVIGDQDRAVGVSASHEESPWFR